MAKRRAPSLNRAAIQALEQGVFALVQSLVDEHLYVLDVALECEAQQWYLRVALEGTVERVGLDDCERISRQLSPLLDTFAPLNATSLSYTLEVGSPGAFRTLKKPREFEFFKGRRVWVRTQKPKALPFRYATLVDFQLEPSPSVLLLPEWEAAEKAESPVSEPISVALQEHGGLTISLEPVLQMPDEDDGPMASPLADSEEDVAKLDEITPESPPLQTADYSE